MQKDRLMSKLDGGIVPLNKQRVRVVGEGYMKSSMETSVDDAKVINATLTFNNSKKTQMLTLMDCVVPRDDSMYVRNDLYRNIQLENTKDIRERLQEEKNKERLARARMRT